MYKTKTRGEWMGEKCMKRLNNHEEIPLYDTVHAMRAGKRGHRPFKNTFNPAKTLQSDESPESMLQRCFISYGNAQRYRQGVNYGRSDKAYGKALFRLVNIPMTDVT